jgi:hypothetical protein
MAGRSRGFGARAFGEFLVCRIAEDAARCTVAASVPDKFRIFQNFGKFFSNNPIDLLGGEAPPGQTRAPLSRNFPKKSFSRDVRQCCAGAAIQHTPAQAPQRGFAPTAAQTRTRCGSVLRRSTSLVAARFSSYIRFFDEHDVFELRRLMSNARRKRIRVLTETKDPVSDATSIMSFHELSRYCFR